MVASTASSALVIGEALTDIVVTAEGEHDHPGGSPFNVAITLGRLGDPVSLLTAIGDDERGAEIERRLDASSVALAEGSRHAGRTSTALARLQADGSARYEFDITWELPDAPALAPSSVTHAGSIALFLEPGASQLAALLRERGVESLVTLDPNIRPALVGTRDDALARVEALLEVVDLVKLSDEDAAWLYPGSEESAVLERLLALGPAVAVMTRGGSGSLLATPEVQVEVPAPSTTVADTIGAGDSYMGALIHQLLTTPLGVQLRTGDLPDAAQLSQIGEFASRVAAITVSRSGANPPHLAELD